MTSESELESAPKANIFGYVKTEAVAEKPDYLYSSNEEVYSALRKGNKVLGTPGASLTWGIDGNRDLPSLSSGKEGEAQIGAILNTIAEATPGAFVFHSLSWPESNGDTDHILLYKNCAVIVDAKRWKSKRKYSVTAQGEIKRGTVLFEEGKVKIAYALRVWREKLPKNIKVFGVVAIAQEEVFVVRDKHWFSAGFRLVEAEKLTSFIEDLLKKEDQRSKNQKPTLLALLTLGRLLVKAREGIKIKFQ